MVSLIIPTHNRKEYLEKTLISLISQINVVDSDFEVIIVDDASTDNTDVMIRKYINKTNINYVKIPSSNGNPSLVRNAGIRISKGNLISFVDSGMIMNRYFLHNLLQNYGSENNIFVIHEVYGLFSEPCEEMENISSDLLNSESVEEFNFILSNYSYSSKWIDRRKELFKESKIYVPWCYAWSCALTVSKKLIDNSGLFDESFRGWGSEDVDFAYRCFQNGGDFVFDNSNPLFHIPHPTASAKSKEASNHNNRLKMHEKSFSFETEIFLFTYSTHMQSIMSFYDNLILRHVLPEYQSSLWKKISTDLLNFPISRMLIVGAATKEPLKIINNITHAFYVNEKQHFMLQNEGVIFDNQLGCSTRYSTSYFDAVIITDFARILTDVYLVPFFGEMTRIGKNVFFIYDEKFIPYGKEMYGLTWKNMSNIKDTLLNNLSLSKVGKINNQSLYIVENK